MSTNWHPFNDSKARRARPTLTQKLSGLTTLVLPNRDKNSRSSPRGQRPEAEFQIVHTPDRLRATPVDSSEIPDDDECLDFIMALRNKEQQHRGAYPGSGYGATDETSTRPVPYSWGQELESSSRYEQPRSAPKPPQQWANRSSPSWPLTDDAAVYRQQPSSPRAVYRRPPPPERSDKHMTVWPGSPRKRTSLGSLAANDGEDTDSDDPDCPPGTESLRRRADRDFEREYKDMGGAAAYISKRTHCRLCGNMGIPGPGGLCPQCVQDFMVPKEVFRADLDSRISADLASMQIQRRTREEEHARARGHSTEWLDLPPSRTATISPTPSLLSDSTETCVPTTISPTSTAGHVAHQMKIIALDAAPRKVFVPVSTRAAEAAITGGRPDSASTLLERRMRRHSPGDLDSDNSEIVRVGHVRTSTPQMIPPGWEDLVDNEDPHGQLLDDVYYRALRTDGSMESDKNAPVSPILNPSLFHQPGAIRDSKFYDPFDKIYSEYAG